MKHPSPQIVCGHNSEKISSADAADLVRQAGISGVVMRGLHPIIPAGTTVAGRARTLRFLPEREDVPSRSSGPVSRDLYESMESNEVLVIDAMGSMENAVIGDMMYSRLAYRGVKAIFVDGAVRDAAAAADKGLALHAVGCSPKSFFGFVRAWDVDQDIQCGGVLVRRGDWIVADIDGIVVVPVNVLAQVLKSAQARRDDDRFSQALFAAGYGLDDAYPCRLICVFLEIAMSRRVLCQPRRRLLRPAGTNTRTLDESLLQPNIEYMSDLSQQQATQAAGKLPIEVISSLTPEHYRVLALSAMGGMLEYYEFTVFIFLSPFISQVFFPQNSPAWLNELQTLTIFAAGYFTRPFGGIILSSLGDRLGRKRMFALSVLIMAAPTLLIGLLPGYQRMGIAAPAALLLCRLAQGVALGGELPTAMVFVSEHVPQRRIGFAFGVIGASVVLGFVLASGLIRQMLTHFSHDQFVDFAWRIPFLIGGCFGFLSAFMRRYVSETPVFKEMRDRRLGEAINPLKVLLGRYRRETLLCLVLSIVPGVVIPGVHIFPAVYLETFRHFNARIVSNGLFWLQITLFFSSMAGGIIVDRLGWKVAIIGTFVLLVGTIFGFYAFVRPATVIVWFVLLGVFLSGLIMSYCPLVFSFPAQIRLTGISTVYNLSAALFGGTTPIVMQLLAHRGGWGVAIYPAVVLLVGVVVIPALWRLRKPLFAVLE